MPIGGGGVISGIAIAAKELLPEVRIIGVQTENVSTIRKSLAAGKPVKAGAGSTIADGIAVKCPGELTLPIIRELVDEIVEVSEDEIAKAIYFAMQNNRLVVEGAGAAGLAALLSKKIKVNEDDTVCTVLCGGNIDANLLARVLEQVLVRNGRYIILKVLVNDRPGMLAGLARPRCRNKSERHRSDSPTRNVACASGQRRHRNGSRSSRRRTRSKASKNISKIPAITSNAKASATGKR